jgi:alpha-N-arabinofuranosidase
MNRTLLLCILSLIGTRAFAADSPLPAPAVMIHVGQPAKAISPDLFGIFFEDLSYAADGGLYAELIQNRSFEYQATEQPTWNALTAWQVTLRGNSRGDVMVQDADPIHPNNPHYAVLRVSQLGAGVGLMNSGFDGIPLKAGEKYNVSLFARQIVGRAAPLDVRLESQSGALLGEARLPAPTGDWTRLAATITASQTDDNARFVLLATAPGQIGLDVISLFPQKTFHDRPNGLRPDLAQVIADLKPKFVRFPGGCLVHGDGLANIYRWKDTIGPIEQRREQKNIWRYHQSVGLGFFEYFQFCEDIGAKPLPVLAAGVCCQNSGNAHGTGQKGLPMEQMPAYVQDVLDLIDYANGPATSTWGAKRAASGHPAPFHLQYIGIGNEDAQTPVFRERFKMIYDAVRKRHPEITVVGTVGPAPDGADFDAGWAFASQLHVPVVDEHYYQPPGWFWDHLPRYDRYNRDASHVYVGEYAARDIGARGTLRAALAEAAHMTALERNGDVVHMASYAPLLANVRHTRWRPDLIYFDNQTVCPSVSYYVQQLFARNSGDFYLPTTIEFVPQPPASAGVTLAASCVRDSASGDVILKVVSRADVPVKAQFDLGAAGVLDQTASCTVLTGDLEAENAFGKPAAMLPATSQIPAGKQFAYEVPAHSLSVIRLKVNQSSLK